MLSNSICWKGYQHAFFQLWITHSLFLRSSKSSLEENIKPKEGGFRVCKQGWCPLSPLCFPNRNCLGHREHPQRKSCFPTSWSETDPQEKDRLGESPVSCLFTGGLGPGGQEGLIKSIMETMTSGIQGCRALGNHLVLIVRMRTLGPKEEEGLVQVHTKLGTVICHSIWVSKLGIKQLHLGPPCSPSSHKGKKRHSYSVSVISRPVFQGLGGVHRHPDMHGQHHTGGLFRGRTGGRNFFFAGSSPYSFVSCLFHRE